MPTEWEQRKAKLTLPILIEAAKEQRELTYAQLGSCIGVIPVEVGRVLGVIRDHVCWPGWPEGNKQFPLLNVLVVNQDTGIPGDEFLPGGTSHLSDTQKRTEWERLKAEVYEYEGWDALLEAPDPISGG